MLLAQLPGGGSTLACCLLQAAAAADGEDEEEAFGVDEEDEEEVSVRAPRLGMLVWMPCWVGVQGGWCRAVHAWVRGWGGP